MMEESSISRAIDEMEERNVRKHKIEAARRKRQFIYFLITILSVAGLIVLLTLSDNKGLIIPIFAAASGFLGGLGFQRFRP